MFSGQRACSIAIQHILWPKKMFNCTNTIAIEHVLLPRNMLYGHRACTDQVVLILLTCKDSSRVSVTNYMCFLRAEYLLAVKVLRTQWAASPRHRVYTWALSEIAWGQINCPKLYAPCLQDPTLLVHRLINDVNNGKPCTWINVQGTFGLPICLLPRNVPRFVFRLVFRSASRSHVLGGSSEKKHDQKFLRENEAWILTTATTTGKSWSPGLIMHWLRHTGLGTLA